MPCEDDEWESIDVTDSQVKCIGKLEESANSSMEPVVKKEPASDDDIQFMGEFVKGSYNGPQILVDCIKQEYISPKDLEEYNKFAEDKDKLVIIKEKIENVYDVGKVHGKERLEKLLKGVHGEQYKKIYVVLTRVWGQPRVRRNIQWAADLSYL